MSKCKLFAVTALVAMSAIVSPAFAREVCKEVSLPTMNCTPKGCFVTYTTARICKEVPDGGGTKTTATNAAASAMGTPASMKGNVLTRPANAVMATRFAKR